MNSLQKKLREELENKIKFGNETLHNLSHIQNIDGVIKLQRKIKQEISFLKKLQNTNVLDKEQLASSNLRHLAEIAKYAFESNVTSVCKVAPASCGNKISIDIVCDNGRIWVKVIARNPKALSALSEGNSSYGTRSIIDQAKDYINCANQYPYHYQRPQIVFIFACGIEDILVKKLQKHGIIVKGKIINTDINIKNDESFEDITDVNNQLSTCKLNDEIYIKDDFSPEKPITEINILNLDVTTMMAYTSNLTNGRYNYIFKQPLLSQQAIWESKKSVKPILENLFQGKNLICCESAWSDFMKIVQMLGGPSEKVRAEELGKMLTIMPDDKNGPDEPKYAELKVKGRIRLRSKIIFNFGQRLHAITISANDGFVRSAKQQGIVYAAIIHESRALTEEKEKSATPIDFKP